MQNEHQSENIDVVTLIEDIFGKLKKTVFELYIEVFFRKFDEYDDAVLCEGGLSKILQKVFVAICERVEQLKQKYIGVEIREFNKFLRHCELQDTLIVDSLHRAAENYENGELIEVRDLLIDIVVAINLFEEVDMFQ